MQRTVTGIACLLMLSLAAVRCETLAACNLEMSEFDLLSTGYSKLFGVNDLEVPELFEWRKSDATRPLLFIDVREPQEQSVSHLPGAVLARVDEDLGGLPAVREFREQYAADSRARIVVYCAAGYRSGRSISEMSGDMDTAPAVLNLRGGIIAYANAGGPLVTPAGAATNKVHGYNEKWSSYLKPPAQPVLEPPIPDA